MRLREASGTMQVIFELTQQSSSLLYSLESKDCIFNSEHTTISPERDVMNCRHFFSFGWFGLGSVEAKE
jgi:hypothetical protein